MRNYFVYYGIIVTRNTQPGYALRWTAFGPNGQLAADTQAGIKQLIREAFNKGSK